MTRLTLFVCLATCLFTPDAAAQLPTPPQYPRLEMSVGLTAMSPGPAARTEQALYAMGFREPYRPSMTQSDIQGFWKIEIGTSDRRTLGIMKTRVANRTSGSVDLSGQGGVNLKWKRDGGGFAHALWQYRYAGSLMADEVNVPVHGRLPNQTIQWPSTRIPFSHRMIGIGFGVEF